MKTPCPESVSSKRKRVIIRELAQGHEAATELKKLLQNPIGAEGSLSAEELVANVQRSFTECLSILTSNSSSEQGCGEGGKNPVNSGENGSPVSVDSGECRKRSLTATKNGGRGCYKRRS